MVHSLKVDVRHPCALLIGLTALPIDNTIAPPTGGGILHGSTSPKELHECDFDDSANVLWSLYGEEAERHDKATIETLKDDMDGVLIFAGLFSAALTAFVIDRAQNIQQTPAQQSAYFQQQSVVLLNLISNQLSSLGAQPSNSLNLSLSAPVSPSASDVRVNTYFFMSLIFSLSAALLATLVQRWARDYMHIFKRYRNPRKLARIRQYLHEGVEGWGMSATAEAVPVLVHISLFLFFIGVVDFLLSAHATVGYSILFPITLCAALYVISTIAPVMNPQSPYRTSFSRLVWYLFRKKGKQLFKQPFGKGAKPLSMEDVQKERAMEGNDACKRRDERAIGWLADNLRGDGEMETFALGIPGSFNTEYGQAVWRGAAGIVDNGHANVCSDESITGPATIHDLPVYIPPPFPAPTTVQHTPKPPICGPGRRRTLQTH
ncbi:hypothetical protein F5148DRAFT_985252 [Russula earlei]|uniref:Uncharacterized protein n=1 Tax=Russula earlei TaxID=71964 RepID=A0ACC0TZP2_9AGAM|nr:hypothetical protein F5148DRAFT_985252 [Russula earlei]